MPPSPKPKIREDDLQGFKHFKALSSLLERLHGVGDDHRRVLHMDQYLCLILLYYFNPVLTSMRGLVQASGLPKVQKKLGVPKTSLGAFSEAGSVFPAEYVADIVTALAKKVSPVTRDPRLKTLSRELTAVDGTLLKALPRMVWALWQSETNRAAKAHVQFEILKGVPYAAVVTDANASETRTLMKNLEPGRVCVMDRGYLHFALYNAILARQSSFVARVEERTVMRETRDLPLTDADRAANVIKDQTGTLGAKNSSGEPIPHTLRVVEVLDEKPNGKTSVIRLVTDLLDLPAETVALIYRYRWQVELFFRWLKVTLRCKHLLSENPNGVQLQVYAAFIATLLIVLWTGCKPTKRTFELLCLYFQGWATVDDVLNHIASLKKAK